MVKQKCKCCQENKSSISHYSPGIGFNRLNGDAREWAKDNKFPRSEYCVPVKGGNRFSGAKWQKDKCGDGRMGFSTRRKNQDDISIEIGLDGQFKKKRSTLIRPKSSRATASRRNRRIDGSKCGLVCLIQIMEGQRDPVVVAWQRKMTKKIKRARNRNRSAARGWKSAMKQVA